ncbi:hypothetical protein NPIL_507931 [Nephila pilipes]|uniref:Uncharacterized protein n=1 Tax=Nephila pilipes TaxID=299642 RepID=A0A8X6N4R2_NEPPI|nr:hypothetical protein NPIL_507931 [Nephila pilipes]
MPHESSKPPKKRRQEKEGHGRETEITSHPQGKKFNKNGCERSATKKPHHANYVCGSRKRPGSYFKTGPASVRWLRTFGRNKAVPLIHSSTGPAITRKAYA